MSPAVMPRGACRLIHQRAGLQKKTTRGRGQKRRGRGEARVSVSLHVCLPVVLVNVGCCCLFAKQQGMNRAYAREVTGMPRAAIMPERWYGLSYHRRATLFVQAGPHGPDSRTRRLALSVSDSVPERYHGLSSCAEPRAMLTHRPGRPDRGASVPRCHRQVRGAWNSDMFPHHVPSHTWNMHGYEDMPCSISPLVGQCWASMMPPDAGRGEGVRERRGSGPPRIAKPRMHKQQREDYTT